jgi:hypothetical protein
LRVDKLPVLRKPLSPEERARLVSAANDKRQRRPITLPRIRALEGSLEDPREANSKDEIDLLQRGRQ